MKEKLSALMDGELDGQLADRTIKAITEEEELKQVWDAYHLIGDAMRDNSHVSVNVRQRVATRLAAEPTVLAPRRWYAPVSGHFARRHQQYRPVLHAEAWWQGPGGAA